MSRGLRRTPLDLSEATEKLFGKPQDRRAESMDPMAVLLAGKSLNNQDQSQPFTDVI
jgi:hypothetical protein